MELLLWNGSLFNIELVTSGMVTIASFDTCGHFRVASPRVGIYDNP